MTKPVRADWRLPKERRFIFEYLVLKMLWAIFLAVTDQKGKGQMVAASAATSIVYYIEANKTNPESTTETIGREMGIWQ